MQASPSPAAAPPAAQAAAAPQATTKLGVARVLVPALLAALLSAAVLGIAVYSYAANRRDALQLTDDTLALLEERIGTEVASFLGVPERALGILAEFAGHRAILPHERPAAVESATALLRAAPMLALIGFADAEGNFLMIRRDPETGEFETRTVATEGGQRRVFWSRPGPDGKPTIADDPEDVFDPRSRPWWRPAVQAERTAWTDLYVFATDRQPGVSAARALRQGPVLGVVMADIRLSSLSRFIGRLAIGKSGRALVLDQDGRLVAVGDSGRAVVVTGEDLSPARLSQLHDPVLDRAFDLFRAEGPGRRVIEVNDQRNIVLASRLPGEGRNWNLLLVVPEEDFVGFVGRNSFRALLMAFGVVGLAAALAWLVIRQNLRAERAREVAAGRAQALADQTSAFVELAAAGSAANILAVVGAALSARRVGLWRLAEGGRVLVCEAQHDVAAGTHAAGPRLRRADAPHLFDAVAAGREIDAPAAASDERTADLARLYLRPMGATGLLSLPVVRRDDGTVLGALWVEDSGRGRAPPLELARAAASLLAPSLAPVADTPAIGAEVAAHRQRGEKFLARMREQAATVPGQEDVQLFPLLAVMVIEFAAENAIETATDHSGMPLLDQVARILRAAATAAGAPCLRILGERVMIADGFDRDPEDAVRRLGDAALAIQDRLTEAFTSCRLGLDFRIGLDLGPAAATRSTLAANTVSGISDWNVFGEAARAAAALAASAPPGAIQVSETAHAELAAEFVLRARGRFFIPDTGELGTWLVARHA